MPSRIKILRAAPNHMVFRAKNTLLMFPKHMTATHHAAVLGHAHFLTHKRLGAFIYLINNGVVLLKPFRRYFLIIFHTASSKIIILIRIKSRHAIVVIVATIPRRNGLARRNSRASLACRHFSSPQKLKIFGDPIPWLSSHQSQKENQIVP